MTKSEVEHVVIEVLTQFQNAQCESVPASIDRQTCPIDDLSGFDSLLAIEATVELQDKLGCSIPDVNIFVAKEGNRPLRIHEIGEQLCELLTSKGKPDER